MSNQTRWLLVSTADVPRDDAWLSERETTTLRRLATAPRQASWRLGRFAAKEALRCWIGDAAPPLAAIDVATSETGAPLPSLWSVPTPWALTLSHRADRALCAIGPPERALGCDLELVEPRDSDFVADYFTRAERDAIAAAGPGRHELTTVLWSAKESVLKALGEGLRRDTRDVDVTVAEATEGQPAGWRAFLAHTADTGTWRGWWHTRDGFVLTFAGLDLERPPIEF